MEYKLWLKDTWDKLSKKLKWECEVIGNKIPYIAYDGVYEDYTKEKLNWWTNGFWPGILWLMYNETDDEQFAKTALSVEENLERGLASFQQTDHDLGFRWSLSAVASYRLTKNPVSHRRAMLAANLLLGRYNSKGKFIRAWDNQDRTNWMIIDCLMNLPLLHFASNETGDVRFSEAAKNHLDTSLRLLLRGDGSCNHIADINLETGEANKLPGGQGYECGSSWSRGQAWGIYGFALGYKYTGDIRYLNVAKSVTHYFISQVVLNGYIPKLDFRAPKEPYYIDTTAAAIACRGLMEIAELVVEYERESYIAHAVNMLRSLTEKHCNWEIGYQSILQNGSVMYHDKEKHAPIIYGDFFLLEAILKLKGSDFLIW